MMITLPDDTPTERHVFVFGSNCRGIHGAGAAATARHRYGARLGVGEGLTGRAYALPTVGSDMRPLPLDAIRAAVRRFLWTAAQTPDHTYWVTPIGCGLAGYSPAEIGPMFGNSELPSNVVLPGEFLSYCQET